MVIDTNNSFKYRRIADTYNCCLFRYNDGIYTGEGYKIPFMYNNKSITGIGCKSLICTDTVTFNTEVSYTSASAITNTITCKELNSDKDVYLYSAQTYSTMFNIADYSKYALPCSWVVQYYTHIYKNEHGGIGVIDDEITSEVKPVNASIKDSTKTITFTLTEDEAKNNYIIAFITCSCNPRGYMNIVYEMVHEGSVIEVRDVRNQGHECMFEGGTFVSFLHTFTPGKLKYGNNDLILRAKDNNSGKNSTINNIECLIMKGL